ncbi:hypothetical protein E2C01_004870 [Portunus trituberculatus]|uniref:Uncharacterized protein n=1 Tax=Portunus trituberculatus TaxID=210409 RepID=A0A5B7CR53_PORTR|nr:hypothetical protein [Portunus trituberculatus]
MKSYLRLDEITATTDWSEAATHRAPGRKQTAIGSSLSLPPAIGPFLPLPPSIPSPAPTPDNHPLPLSLPLLQLSFPIQETPTTSFSPFTPIPQAVTLSPHQFHHSIPNPNTCPLTSPQSPTLPHLALPGSRLCSLPTPVSYWSLSRVPDC